MRHNVAKNTHYHKVIKGSFPYIVGIKGKEGFTLGRGSQGTTLSASDLHNARATILNPFYTLKYNSENDKIRRESRQIFRA